MTNSSNNNPQKAVDPRKLRRAINDSFSEDDLRDLCFELRLDFENLPGTVKKDKVRELIIHFDRRKRINILVDAFYKLRPDIDIEAIILEEVDEEDSEFDVSQSNSNNGFLSFDIISTYANASAWNQGAPLSPFKFVINLALANKSHNTVILRSFELNAFEIPLQLLKQSSPVSMLLIVKDNHYKSPVSFPFQISGKHLGLVEYHITAQLDDHQRLTFPHDSEAFQKYSFELGFEYYDITGINRTSSIVVHGSFQDFVDNWHETWSTYLANKGKSTLLNPDDEKRPSRWKKFND